MTTTNATTKRLAAVREAGHLTVAHATGLTATAWLKKKGVTQRVDDSHWVGRSVLLGGRTSPAVVVAGFVAEQMDGGATSTSEMLSALEQNPRAISESDRASLPQDRAELGESIQIAATLLAKHKRIHTWTKRALLDNDFVTGGQLAAAFGSNN